VVLPTGRVVGCDPFVAQAVPFVDAVTPGRYQLRAWVAVLSKDGAESQRRIAALQLVVLDEPVADRTMALHLGQEVACLGDDEYFGYGVDTGTGTLADQVAIEALNQWDYEQVEDAFIPAQIPERFRAPSRAEVDCVVSGHGSTASVANLVISGQAASTANRQGSARCPGGRTRRLGGDRPEGPRRPPCRVRRRVGIRGSGRRGRRCVRRGRAHRFTAARPLAPAPATRCQGGVEPRCGAAGRHHQPIRAGSVAEPISSPTSAACGRKLSATRLNRLRPWTS
jgi:Protein of unknown function (DUF4241)